MTKYRMGSDFKFPNYTVPLLGLVTILDWIYRAENFFESQSQRDYKVQAYENNLI